MEELMEDSLGKPPAPGTVHRDVVYHSTLLGSHRLDIYEPFETRPDAGAREGDAPVAPVVVFYHGGSWVKGDKVTIRVVDRFLNRMRERGYFVIAVNYTSSMLRGLRGPIENTKRSLRWIADHADEYGYDQNKVGLYGVSAGGHVALMAASTMEPESFSISFLFIECAPTDLLGLREGEAFDSSYVFKFFPKHRLRELSPINHVSADLPPILIFHGTEDRTVDIVQSERYVESVRRAGGEAELVRYEGGDHVFLNFSDEQWEKQETRALGFFEEQFK